MSHKVYLSLVFHNHQPVGNFDFVFREAYEKSYLPMVAALERHPQINAALHFTGPLRDWLLANEPDYYYERVGALVERGQIEMIGGAYYEPILVMLDDDDKLGQMQKLNDALYLDFGVRPVGMWLAERVWEPALAKPIVQAGLRYVIVDDTHFHFAGFRDEELYGYYITEEQNYPLRLVPAVKQMRNSMPWRDVADFVAYLRSVHDDPATPDRVLFVAADDGEKFGLWPGTYRRCWEEGWVDALFTAFEENVDWLQTTTLQTYLDEFPATGRAYLPTASYLEMTEWALPHYALAELPLARNYLEREIAAARENIVENPRRLEYLEATRRYLRGGLWRNFLVKYPEANHMQKRSAYSSRRARQLPHGDARTEAMNYLWAAQCNCAYWHGWFGGVYLFHIRAANYTNILEAEARILDDRVHIERIDFDLDSMDELVIAAQPFSFVVNLPYGGALVEWDDIPSRYNLLNIMTRHEEGYHQWLREAALDGRLLTPENPAPGGAEGRYFYAKEAGIQQHLVVDLHRRGTLIDHFLTPETDLEAFSRADYSEMGDFFNQPYQCEVNGGGMTPAKIRLWRDGRVQQNGEWHPLRLEKTFVVASGERHLPVTYTLINTSTTHLSLRFGVEATFGFDGGDGDLCYFHVQHSDHGHLGISERCENVDEYRIGTHIRGFEVTVQATPAVELWRFQLAPVTNSEAGFERIHQGAVFLHLHQVELAPGASWQGTLHFDVHNLG